MARMRVVSVNVSLPRRVPYKGRTVSTAIFKEPVAGRIPVRAVGLQGDAVGDPRVHGAPNKAVYGYPSEHYAFWSAELPELTLPWGMFGENLTTEGPSRRTCTSGTGIVSAPPSSRRRTP